MHYDLIVIGGGPAGYTGAIYAAQNGMKTAVVEKDQMGGTCLNRGCIPTKSLLHTAEEIRSWRNSKIFLNEPEFDIQALYEKTGNVISQLRTGVETLIKANGIDLIRGNAFIKDAKTVTVDGEEHTADHILVAAGSIPAKLNIEGSDLEGVISSDDLFADLPEKIGKLVIVGGGVIGCEIASVYSELGSEVTILEYMPNLLPQMDKDIGKNLQVILKKRGVKIQCGAQVTGFSKVDQLQCHYTVKGKENTVDADMILVSTGRRANVAGLFDESLGIEVNRGIVTDGNFETAVKGIYAAGDIRSSSIMLAHAASAEAVNAVAHMLQKKPPVCTDVIPACVYTSPEIAVCGLSEEAAKEKGIEARSKKVTLFSNARTMIAEADRSFIKIVYDENDKLLGAALMCERASDLVNEYSAAIVGGLDIHQMASIIRPHPSFSEAATDIFEAAAGSAIHLMPEKR